MRLSEHLEALLGPKDPTDYLAAVEWATADGRTTLSVRVFAGTTLLDDVLARRSSDGMRILINLADIVAAVDAALTEINAPTVLSERETLALVANTFARILNPDTEAPQ